MKIAQIAPIIERVPPKKYGGTERVVYALTEELVKRGHEVTLFASGDSLTSATLSAVVPEALKETRGVDPYGLNALTSLHYGLAYHYQDKFDIIHDHMGSISLPTANSAKTPVVMTIHGPFSQDVQQTYSILNKPYIVTISKAQYRMAPLQINHMGTIYHGLPMKNYPFSTKHEGYLLFVGRITESKGLHIAIKAAEKLNLPLIIAAKLEAHFKDDVTYFRKYIQPKLSEKIKWIGEVEEHERNQLMSKALCFLHPVSWPEPFGLAIIEAMACGTPVIAIGKGSIPELILHGKTGFVVNNTEELISSIKKVGTINRSFCKTYARETYTVKRMTDEYEAVYERILLLTNKRKPSQRKVLSTYKKIYSATTNFFETPLFNSVPINLSKEK